MEQLRLVLYDDSSHVSITFNSLAIMSAVAPKPTASTSGDPYFQELFADRIGGAQNGKANEIYKFEKIKRAKRKALAGYWGGDPSCASYLAGGFLEGIRSTEKWIRSWRNTN